ncbi:MAG: hypothetical protein IJ939_00915 [Clostridia bacterium]|nr:hypothetical protein [Clostridia bacterium]
MDYSHYLFTDDKKTIECFPPILEATKFLVDTIKRVGYSKFDPHMSNDGVKLYYVYIPETSSCRVDLRFAEYNDSYLESPFRGWKGGYTNIYGNAGHVYLDFPCVSKDDISTFGFGAQQALKEIKISGGNGDEYCFNFIDWFD